MCLKSGAKNDVHVLTRVHLLGGIIVIPINYLSILKSIHLLLMLLTIILLISCRCFIVAHYILKAILSDVWNTSAYYYILKENRKKMYLNRKKYYIAIFFSDSEIFSLRLKFLLFLFLRAWYWKKITRY